MSLMKLIKTPVNFIFGKEVITFFVIRRYDLGIHDNSLKYLAIKPSASLMTIRQKIWYILELPDYCEEFIIIKTVNGMEVPLIQLRKGNDPQCPYTVEVWPSSRNNYPSPYMAQNMLTMREEEEILSINNITTVTNVNSHETQYYPEPAPTVCLDKTINNEKSLPNTLCKGDGIFPKPLHKKSLEHLSRNSSTSIFFKLHSRKSRDNFASILLKIQTDLSTLSNKLSTLENKFHT